MIEVHHAGDLWRCRHPSNLLSGVSGGSSCLLECLTWEVLWGQVILTGVAFGSSTESILTFWGSLILALTAMEGSRQ